MKVMVKQKDLPANDETKKSPRPIVWTGVCCRGRVRTFTGTLAAGQEENFSGQPVILRLSFPDYYLSADR